MEKPISVIMSVYNEKESYLKEAIESILHQSFTDFEFIIINDGSLRPEIVTLLSHFEKQDKRIRVSANPTNIGLTQSLNKALTLASGTYIARIDSDDTADRHRLEKQWQFMENNLPYALCGSWSYFIDQNGTITGEKKSPTDYEIIKKRLLFFNFFTHSSFFFRRDVALSLGGYNNKLKKAQDYDFLLKISAQYPIAVLPEFLSSNRLHAESISSHAKKKQEWYALIARWNAIRYYGYPKTDCFKIIPSVFYFLFIPYFMEKKILKILYKKT